MNAFHHRFLCEKSRNECIFCDKRKRDQAKTKKQESDLDANEFYNLPQRVRALAYSKTQLAIKMKAVICGRCLQISDKHLLNLCRDREVVRARVMGPNEKLTDRWWERYNGTVRSLFIHSQQRADLRVENAELKENQRTEWDVTHKYRRINVDLLSQNTKREYLRRKQESEQKWSGEGTNRHNNYISYWKLSSMDCFMLCHNTRAQIAQMAEHCCLSEEMIFFWWHRFYRKTSFAEQSILFGVSKSGLRKMWKASTSKLAVWAKQFLIHDGPDSDQYWTKVRVYAPLS